MDTNNVERNLQSLRRLYGLLQSNANNESIPQPFLLDENTQFLLKTLLDYATNEILATQSKIIAAAQFGLPETIPSPSTKTRINNVSQIKRIGSSLSTNPTFKRNGQSEQVNDSIERIETVLSALSFRSSRVETKPCMSRITKEYSSGLPYEGYETQRLTEKTLMEHRQRMSQTGSSSNISPSLRSVNGATEAIVRSRDDRTLPPRSQPPGDQFVRVKSRAALPPLPVKSVGFKKPSQSKRMSQKMMSIKPTLLDQETESWEESASDKTHSRTGTEQESEENSRETESRSSGSSWETQEESVSGEEKSLDESVSSSYTSESDDSTSEVSASPPPHKGRNGSKPRKKPSVMGRFTRLKNKFGQVLHLHQHHHHHHHPHNKEQNRKPSAWKHLQRALHYKRKEKAVEKQMKSEFKGLTKHNQEGGHFHGLVQGLMRHRKQKNKFPSHGKKKQWWKTYKQRQGRVKFPTKGRVKKHYLLNKHPET